jgi:hypothetical protein
VITSVQKEGWAGVENGKILSHVDGHFDVLLLADKNLRYQQKLSGRTIALVELPTNRWPVLKRMTKRILQTVEAATPGSYTIVPEEVL